MSNFERLVSDEEMQIIMNATIKLTKLRQNKCEHLSIENCAPDIYRNLMKAHIEAFQPPMFMESEVKPHD